MKTQVKTNVMTMWAAMAVIAALIMITSAYAGDLEPSDPPGSTMKTLDEVEPRIPIHADDLPMTITESGSYYFTESIEYADANTPITIEANDVTVDLMGYTLKGPDSGYSYGIKLSECSNVEVRNGTVRDFYRGITTYSTGSDHRIINIRAVSNTVYGIYLATAGCMVRDCTASGNGNTGIYLGDGCTVIGNTAYGNTSNGIIVGSGGTVKSNTAYDNGNSGFYVGIGCTVKSNTAYDNGNDGIYAYENCIVTNNNCYQNTDDGICAAKSTIIGNLSSDNGDNGIYSSYSVVSGNTCRGNGDDGIYAYGSTISGNMAYDNTDMGIACGSGSNVAGNTAYGNTGWGIYCSSYCMVDQNTSYDNGDNLHTGTGCVVGTNVAP